MSNNGKLRVPETTPALDTGHLRHFLQTHAIPPRAPIFIRMPDGELVELQAVRYADKRLILEPKEQK